MPWVARGSEVMGQTLRGLCALTKIPLSTSVARRLPALIVAVTCGAYALRAVRPINRHRIPLMRASTWVGEHTPSGARVLGLMSADYLSVYAGRRSDRVRAPGAVRPAVAERVAAGAYAAVVVEGEHFPPDAPVVATVASRYIEREIRGVTGGERSIRVFMRPGGSTEGLTKHKHTER
jgi:hypothetical protein